MNRISKIAQRMDDTFRGSPWHGGGSLLEGLKAIPNANTRMSNSNAIGQIAEHLLEWKKLGLEKMKGNAEYDIVLNSEKDWNPKNRYSPAEWANLLQQLVQIHEAIIALCKEKEDPWLDSQVPGRAYSFEHLLEGLIQHDVYHYGQMTILKKLG